MASSLERRNQTYYVNFRFDGCRYRRSLRTTDRRVAQAAVARLDDNLRRVELGFLELPDDVDVASFLLSDGLRATTEKSKRATLQTIGQL